MRRRALLGMGVVGLAGAATCSWWSWEPQPRPDLVALTGRQTRQVVPANVESELWAVLRVTVDEGADEERPPVHVGLVIDTSASMAGPPLEAAKAAAIELVGALQDGDRLTVVTFDSRAALVVPSVALDDDARDEARRLLAEIEARGTTDLAAGLQLALGDLLPHTGEGRVTRLVLLSDGVPNDASAIPSAVAQASGAGITVTALGFGLDYDETLLASVAQQTGGTFHFLEAPADLVPIFREENLRLQGVEARELVLSLTTGPGVALREVVGHAVALPQPRLYLGLGDLSRGEERVVVVRLAVGPHRAGATIELLDAMLTYRDPRTGATMDQDAVFLSAHAEDDATALAQAIDPELEREIESAKAAALTLQAVALSRQGDDASARDVLQAAAPAAAAAAKRLDDGTLAEQVDDINALVDALERADEDDGDEPAPGLASTPGSGGGGPPKTSGWYRRQAVRRAHGNAMNNFQARKNRR
ncbi:MAG: VWA domain-containing protein [Myxococcales bacterium]|nr:VWA domain-containing protein [Myxococcales bacterium]